MTPMDTRSLADAGASLKSGDSMKKTRLLRAKSFTLVLLVFCLFSACAAQSQALYQADLQKAYQSAIVDAATEDPTEISNNLVPILPSNDKLSTMNY